MVLRESTELLDVEEGDTGLRERASGASGSSRNTGSQRASGRFAARGSCLAFVVTSVLVRTASLCVCRIPFMLIHLGF